MRTPCQILVPGLTGFRRTKNSRMLAEFRELDSYLTDSEDSDGDGSVGEGPSLAQATFANSLLRTGRALLTAARANPIPGTTEIPAVTLRLSRLDPSPPDPRDNDPRIALTIQKLRDMGIDVELGERKENFIDAISTQTTSVLFPQAQVNLDLSILIALVSDLTHAPLPSSPDDANARFTPSVEYIGWKKKRLESIRSALGASDCVYPEPEVDILARPSRALVYQVLQEMDRSLLQDMSDRFNVHSDSEDEPSLARSSVIQFWTTPEAKERCIQIVTKIGGPKERGRMEALFMEDIAQAEELYWQDSRYPKNFIPLLPIRLLPPGNPDDMSAPPTDGSTGSPLSPFFSALAKTCRDILRQDTIPDPRPTPASALDDPNGLERAVVTKANPRLTAHTVQSLLWGAIHGWTTLTANKTSVKAVLKEMRAAHNGALWTISGGVGGNGSDGGVQAAALWQVDPRSLAEGMRADFKPQCNNVRCSPNHTTLNNISYLRF